MNRKDLTGKRFGRLVALEPTKERRNYRVVWRCRCDCGRDYQVATQSLLDGGTTSCGCRGRGPLREDLSGRTFGRVTVNRFAYGECWHVITACGRERLALRRSIVKGMRCCRRKECVG